MSNDLPPKQVAAMGSGTCAKCRRPWGVHMHSPTGNQCVYVAAPEHIPDQAATDLRQWREVQWHAHTARFA